RDLLAMRDLLNDLEDGPLLAAALHVGGAVKGDIWVVDGQPVILNWGMLPEGVGLDQESRSAHFASTLGRFLPLSAAPPLTDAERRARIEMLATQAPPRGGPVASSTPAGVPTGAAAIAATGLGAGGASPPADHKDAAERHEGRAGVPLFAWLPLVI